MKKIVLLTTTIATLMMAPAFAEDSKPTIAVVNIQQIMRDSAAGKSVRSQLEGKQKSFQSDLSKKEESLRKEEQELGSQRGVLAKDAFEQKVRDYQSKVTGTQKEVQTKKATLDVAFERALGDIQKVVTDIIGQMSKERGFSVAIPTSQILYAESNLDITADVLKQLDSKLPNVAVKFDAPAAAAKAPAAKKE